MKSIIIVLTAFFAISSANAQTQKQEIQRDYLTKLCKPKVITVVLANYSKKDINAGQVYIQNEDFNAWDKKAKAASTKYTGLFHAMVTNIKAGCYETWEVKTKQENQGMAKSPTCTVNEIKKIDRECP